MTEDEYRYSVELFRDPVQVPGEFEAEGVIGTAGWPQIIFSDIKDHPHINFIRELQKMAWLEDPFSFYPPDGTDFDWFEADMKGVPVKIKVEIDPEYIRWAQIYSDLMVMIYDRAEDELKEKIIELGVEDRYDLPAREEDGIRKRYDMLIHYLQERFQRRLVEIF